MRKMCLLLLLMMMISISAIAEDQSIHELWDISYNMTLDECMEYLEAEKGLIFDVGDTSIVTTEKQNVSFLGHEAIISVARNKDEDTIKEIHVSFPFINGTDPVSYTYYKTYEEALEGAYQYLEIIPDIISRLDAAYGSPTQGVFTTRSIREAYNLPYGDEGIDLNTLQQALSERGYIMVVCQFNNIYFGYTLDVKEIGTMFHNRPECFLYFRDEARSDAFNGMEGGLGDFPTFEKELDLGL